MFDYTFNRIELYTTSEARRFLQHIFFIMFLTLFKFVNTLHAKRVAFFIVFVDHHYAILLILAVYMTVTLSQSFVYGSY